MTKITDLFPMEELQENIDGGFIREQTHPDYPQLRILNYTELAQFSRQWNVVTRMCRGLIYDSNTMEVLARPFPKIHNWDEPEAPRITERAPLFSWGDKADGSIGIVFWNPYSATIEVATRGSFASDQAVHATEKVEDLLAEDVVYMMNREWTPLVEIIYPDNRIVLDYGELDTLLLLGYIHIETGAFSPPGPMPPRTFYDLVQDLSRPNKEGWVAWLNEYKAVKVKQADYIELHRIVTGLNKKSVWRALKDDTFDELVEKLPDELYAWAEEQRDDILAEYDELLMTATWYLEKCDGFEGSQKDFALRVQRIVPKMFQGWVFGLRAGKNVDDSIWKVLEPKGNER